MGFSFYVFLLLVGLKIYDVQINKLPSILFKKVISFLKFNIGLYRTSKLIRYLTLKGDNGISKKSHEVKEIPEGLIF